MSEGDDEPGFEPEFLPSNLSWIIERERIAEPPPPFFGNTNVVSNDNLDRTCQRAVNEWDWPPGGCIMCRGTGLTLRRKTQHSVLTPRPSTADLDRKADFYDQYEDAPCGSCGCKERACTEPDLGSGNRTILG